jgi:hypothetical protein
MWYTYGERQLEMERKIFVLSAIRAPIMLCYNCCWTWRKLVIAVTIMIAGRGKQGSLAFSSSSSVSSSPLSSQSASVPPTTTSCAVIGCGVLGTSLCQQILANPDLSSWKGTWREMKRLLPTLFVDKISDFHSFASFHALTTNDLYVYLFMQ